MVLIIRMSEMYKPRELEGTHAVLHPHIDKRTSANNVHQIAVISALWNTSKEKGSPRFASPHSTSSLNTKCVGVDIRILAWRLNILGCLLPCNTAVCVTLPVMTFSIIIITMLITAGVEVVQILRNFHLVVGWGNK